MKKAIYVLAVTLVIATLVISTTASIPISKNNSDSDNSFSDYEASAAPMNDDSFIQRLKRLLTGEIIDIDISDSAAINSSKIDGVPLHNHDERYFVVFAGNIDGSPFEVNFPEEWADFENVEVTATGYKYNTMDDSKQGPLIIVATVDTEVDKITFEVWDKDGSEYGGDGWAGNEAYIEFVAFGAI